MDKLKDPDVSVLIDEIEKGFDFSRPKESVIKLKKKNDGSRV